MTTHLMRQEIGRARGREATHSAIRAIQEAVSDRFGVRVIDLVAGRRDEGSITPRHVAMWLARRTGATFPAIGEAFGHRDHSTVMHAVRRVDKLLGMDPGLNATVETLIAEIDGIGATERAH